MYSHHKFCNQLADSDNQEEMTISSEMKCVPVVIHPNMKWLKHSTAFPQHFCCAVLTSPYVSHMNLKYAWGCNSSCMSIFMSHCRWIANGQIGFLQQRRRGKRSSTHTTPRRHFADDLQSIPKVTTEISQEIRAKLKSISKWGKWISTTAY